MPRVNRPRPEPVTLSPQEREARLNPPLAPLGKERWPGEFQRKPYLGYCTLGHYGCPVRSHYAPESVPEWMTPRRVGRLVTKVKAAMAQKLCLLGHEQCKERSHFVQSDLRQTGKRLCRTVAHPPYRIAQWRDQRIAVIL